MITVEIQAVTITFYGSGGSADSYNLIGQCQTNVTNYGTGVVYDNSNYNTRTWMVTAEIPECSEDFRYKWKQSDTRDGTESKPAVVPFKYLKDHQFMVIYAAIKGPDLIRK